jgi:hypothetical protein
MNLSLFVESLTLQEKKDLHKILHEQLLPKNNETLREFFERHHQAETLPTRLRTAFGDAERFHQRYPEHSIIDMPVKDVTFDHLGSLKGVAKQTWNEFVKLRGY